MAPPVKADVTPEDVNSAATTFAKQQDKLGDVWSDLAVALTNNTGMAGNDGGADKFAHRYDPAAKSVWSAFESAVKVIGAVSRGLVTTANNYVRAEHHSTSGKKNDPHTFHEPFVADDISVSGPDPSKGEGHSSVPDWLSKYWPNGDPDKLRAAGRAWHKARDGVSDITSTLHGAVRSITESNSTECLDAMESFWNSLAKQGDKKAILTALHDACDGLGNACDKYAQAIDDAHSKLKGALIGAGIAVGLTTIAGILLTPFTGGGSDVGAAAADSAEVAAIAGPIVEEFEATVLADVDAAVSADLAVDLEATAEAVPDIEAAEADLEDVDATVDKELTDSEGKTPQEKTDPGGEPTELDRTDATDFRSDQSAAKHYSKHGSDFGATSQQEYTQGARDFLRSAEENNSPARVDADGRIRVYDPQTNTFGVYDSDGTIVSYYKPTSPDYWERNSDSWGQPVRWK
ncbi:MAG: hypothetical protein ACRDQ5_20315 [Sciscionella sp.]